jgi:ComF family protein
VADSADVPVGCPPFLRALDPLARVSQALLGLLANTVAPEECAACGVPLALGGFCSACGEPEPACATALGDVPLTALGAYAPPLSRAITRLKFEGRPDLAVPLALLLARRSSPLPGIEGAAFVPVPLHRERLVERGYNQSALLAARLSQVWGGTFAPRVLERTRATEQQAHLSRDERRDNVENAFAAVRPVRSGSIVLVDDVVTTGATARACVAALRSAGLRVVQVVALARAR